MGESEKTSRKREGEDGEEEKVVVQLCATP